MKIDDVPPSTADRFVKRVEGFSFTEAIDAYDIQDDDMFRNKQYEHIWITFPDGSSVSIYQNIIKSIASALEASLIMEAYSQYESKNLPALN